MTIVRNCGKLVVLEGLNGCGKSTTAAALLKIMKDEGFDVCLYHDPGDTPVGDSIRRLVKDPEVAMKPMAQMLLYTAARAELAARLEPWVLGGGHVILDRWWPSTYAYQGLGGVSQDLILSLVQNTTPPCCYTRRELTFYLQLPIEVAMWRSGAIDCPFDAGVEHGRDRFEVKGREFQEKLADMYMRLALTGCLRVVPIERFGSAADTAKHLWTEYIREEL
jgi:dTMP kinase